MDLKQAVELVERANEWPQCGQDWGHYAEEREAERVLKAAGIELPNGFEHCTPETCPQQRNQA